MNDYPIFAIELDGCWVRFCQPGAQVSGVVYQLLAEIGTLRSIARASHLTGIGAGEVPSISVILSNPYRRASNLIGLPLRRRARVEQGARILFNGVVSSVSYGNTLTLEVSA